MFDRLRNLFRKRPGDSDGRATSLPGTPALNAKSVTGAGLRPPALPISARTAQPQAQSHNATESAVEETMAVGDRPTELYVRLALRPIILALPATLKARVRQPPSGNTQVAVSVDRVLPQLGTGSAKISFGELRQAAPAGIFADLPDQDQAQVELPLNDILSQLPPELLPRRGGQRRVEVPDEVTPIFGPKGEQLTNVRMIKETGRGPAAPAAAPSPIPLQVPPPSRGVPPPAPAGRPSVTPARPAPVASPAPAPVPPPTPAPIPMSPSGPIKPSAPLPSPASLRPAAPAPAAAPAAVSAQPQPARVAHPLYGAKPGGGAAIQSAPAPPRATVAQEPLMVPLKSVLSSLPEAIREAVSQSAGDAVLALPGDEVEQGLKRGKVSFAWGRLRSMLSPAIPATVAAELADTAVDLPLPVIAPLYLAKKKPAAAAKKYEVGDDIPDVFQGRGLSPAVTQAAVAAAAAAAAPAPEPAAPVAAAPDAVPKDIGEVFGQPGRRNWTPIEVVQRTSQLNGVAGALIAMQDGLLVAGQLPPGLSGETIAAFIPQMYSRMMQYCKELKFNDASNLTVVVDSAPLKIFKAGGVFFTVLGREGGSLPEPHLSIVASHLEPQGK